MLQNIRDRFTGGFAIVILALLCVPFVFFGINYNFIGSTYAAKVNGDEIPLSAFDNAYRQQLSQYPDLPESMRPLLKRNVLDSLIREVLVEQHLSEAGYRISDQMITDFIQRVPEFRVDGKFSKDAYYTWLTERGQDPRVFEANQRFGLRQGQLQRGIGATAFVTPAEFRRYLNLYGEEREAALATFDIEAVAETVEVTDEEVQGYYDERPTEFRSEESVDLKYIELRRDELRQQAELTEEEIRRYYDDVSGRYLQDEQRRARHILIPFGDDEDAAREQAEALAERARAGEPFGELAREHSQDSGTASSGGDLGLLPQSQLPEALGDAIFALREGEIAGPARSDFGFHVIRLDEIREGGPLPLEDVRAEIERELRDRQAAERWLELEDAVADALFDAEDIDAMAAGLGLEVQTATGYTRSGGEPFGDNQAAIDAIFDTAVLDERLVSNIIELDANRSVVVQVTEHHEASRLPLAEVRDEIVAALKRMRARDIVRERVGQMQSALGAGEDFEAAAEAAEASSTTTRTIGRRDAETDPRVRDAVFRARKPTGDRPSIGSTATAEGDFVVYSVREATPGRPETIPVQQRDERKRNLAAQSGAADYAAFVMELERRADIVRNQEALAQQSMFE